MNAPRPVRVARDGPVARIILDRPEKRNALSEAMWAALGEAARELSGDTGVRVVIVSGEGGSFAAGADITEFETVYASPERAEAYAATISGALSAIAALPLPVIARIEGACVGGGCAVALACDLRFCSSDARFAVTPARLGLAYPFEDTRRLVDAVGPSAAKDLLFSARFIDADEALRIRLVDRLAPPGELDAVLGDYVDTLLGVSGATARGAKAAVNAVASGTREETARTRAAFRAAFSGEDFKEGYQAFLERRAPRFRTGAG